MERYHCRHKNYPFISDDKDNIKSYNTVIYQQINYSPKSCIEKHPTLVLTLKVSFMPWFSLDWQDALQGCCVLPACVALQFNIPHKFAKLIPTKRLEKAIANLDASDLPGWLRGGIQGLFVFLGGGVVFQFIL